MTHSRKLILGPACAAALVVLAPAAFAAGTGAPTSASTKNEIETFCSNIADPARDRRYLLQKKELTDLQADIDKRVKLLEKRRAEYEDWLTRRNDFLKKAEAGLVDIYAKMDSQAAAAQLQLVDPNVAAAIVMKLKPSAASAILDEMKPESAAMLAGIIASASDPTTSRKNPT